MILALLLLALAAPAFAAERLDLFDRDGKRQGYATIDDRGRIDLYDRQSRRTGYGRVERDRVELFDRESRRLEVITPRRDPARPPAR